MKILAQRANLTIDQFANRLKKAGVDRLLGKITCKYQLYGLRQ